MEEKNIVLYGNIDDGPVVAVVFENETLWLSQRQMAELFNVSLTTINEHLKNIFESGELEQNSTIRNFRIVATNSKSYNVMHYNLDAIIAVGYRVNSIQATHFRQWATQVLKEYIIKGFALDDERLKQAKTVLGKDYFQELLESDTTIAKNYLDEKELKSLERSVNSYFDYIEGQIERKKKFSMLELRQSVDKFLAFNDLPVLEGNGQVSKKQAEEKAHKEYEIFNKTQPIGRDFKKFLNEVKKLKK